MFNKPFPNTLREHRQRAGLFQRDVASLLGLDCADRLSRWENGQAMPSVANLFRLATLYKTEPHHLYPELYAGNQPADSGLRPLRGPVGLDLGSSWSASDLAAKV